MWVPSLPVVGARTQVRVRRPQALIVPPRVKVPRTLVVLLVAVGLRSQVSGLLVNVRVL